MTRHFRKWSWWLYHLLALGLLLYWVQIIQATARWPSGDGPHILGTAARLAQLLKDGELTLFVHCFSSLLGPHPPFAYVLHTAGYLVGGSHPAAHLFGGVFVLMLSFNAFYRLKTPIIGFLWLISLSPVWLQAESAGIDLIAGAVALQSISWLVVSHRLSKLKAVCGWGFWMGCAFMTKYTAPLFLVGPCLIAAYWAIRYSRWNRVVQGFCAFCVVALPWWSTHIRQVLGYVSMAGNSQSGLLTNKNIIDTPWYEYGNLSWYPAAAADAVGWMSIGFLVLAIGFSIVFARQRAAQLTLMSSVLGGWLILNAQAQRQDRYLIPAYLPAAASLGLSVLKLPTSIIPLMLLKESTTIYSSHEPMPAERDYSHSVDTSGQSFPTPSSAYHPTAQDPSQWLVDEALQKMRQYHGSDQGTLGFLLDERNGAPGYGMMLSRSTALGYSWNIATVVMAQPGPQARQEKNRPTASIFVGPFWLGNWPSKDFTVLLSILEKQPSSKVTSWLRENKFEAAETWELPHNRLGIIYLKQL
ncbi:MAG: ArnT family glycosyltransferase [Myxococcota bacterium]